MCKEKKERNVKIVKDIQEGRLTYKEIGKKYNLTKQRVYQFAQDNNISRWEKSREDIFFTYFFIS